MEAGNFFSIFFIFIKTEHTRSNRNGDDPDGGAPMLIANWIYYVKAETGIRVR